MKAAITDTLERSRVDWRKSIAANRKKTALVIVVFFLIYTIFGFTLDFMWWMLSSPHTLADHVNLSDSMFGPLNLFTEHLSACVQGTHIPLVLFILQGFALLAVLWTRLYHGKILLMDTQYSEITETSKDLKQQQLFNLLHELKIAASLSYLPKLYVMESPQMNAFASGWDEKNAIIVVTSTLVENLNREELQAVLAHELSHIRHQDIKLTLAVSVLSNIMLLIAHHLFRQHFTQSYSKQSNKKQGHPLVSCIIFALYIIVPLINTLLVLLLSRTREYLADAGAIELLRDNTGLANALLKIQDNHLEAQVDDSSHKPRQYDNPFEQVRRSSYIYSAAKPTYRARFLQNIFTTHPSVSDRLAAIGFKLQSD